MNRERGLLSLVIPAYNEEGMIEIAYNTISACMKEHGIPYEIIFVDDGSKDDTYSKILGLAQSGAEGARGISFSRNFGKESAIFAGLKEAAGDCVVVMDCDLQHPVETVPRMYELWLQGYDVIEGVKSDRGDESAIHRGFAKLFYSLISSMSNIDMRDTSDFKLLDRVAVDTLVEMPERAPSFRGLSQPIGFNSTRIPFEVAERTVGESKWSFKSLVKYAIHNISVFSAKPLQIVSRLGALFLIIGFIIAIEALYRFFAGEAAAGFTTVICLQLISCGAVMVSLGIIGHYIGLIYDEMKNRPRYIVSRRCSSEDTK